MSWMEVIFEDCRTRQLLNMLVAALNLFSATVAIGAAYVVLKIAAPI